MDKCYICIKKEKREEPLYNGMLPPRNEFYIKTGFFSKDSILICWDCKEMMSDLFGSDSWYDMTKKVLTEDGKSFIEKNKEKIIKKDYKNLPKCKFCSKKSNQLTFDKCEKCGCEFCSHCGGSGCPNCYDEEYTNPIINLLKDKAIKMTVTDISAFIKKDREEVKYALEWMFEEKKINYNGNGRYFILSDNKKAAKTTSKKSDTKDIKTELKKYKQMLEEGLITQEQYDAKSNELLGI